MNKNCNNDYLLKNITLEELMNLGEEILVKIINNFKTNNIVMNKYSINYLNLCKIALNKKKK